MNLFARSIFICLGTCLFLACQNSSTAQQTDTPAAKASVTSVVQTTPANSPIAHLKPPSREGQYPYDILLRKADGTEVSSAEALKYEGKPTIVSFWLTTCGPCMMEFAAIQKKYAKWQDEADFNMVAISTDFEKNHPTFVKMVEDKNWPWDVYLDANRDFWRYMPGGLNGLPQVFVYDKDGEVVYYKRKYKPGDEDTLFAKIKELQ